MAKKFIELQETENLLKRIGAPAYAIHALCLAPSYEAVHRSAYDQCAWERDLAIEQLRNDYGVGLGEKKSVDVVEVVRCEKCIHCMLWQNPTNKVIGDCRIRKMNCYDDQFCMVGAEDFCSYGERRDDNAAD